MSRSSMSNNSRAGWIAAAIAAISVVVVLAIPAVRDFFDDHAGAGLAVIAVAIGLAAWTAHQLLAPLTTVADASLTAGGSKFGPIPVIAFELTPEPRINQFALRVENVGTGPALGLDVSLLESPLNYRQEPPARGRALAPGGMIEATFVLEEEQPFRDASHASRWPRNAADATAIHDAVEPPRDERSGVIADPSVHLARLDELQARYGTYRREVLAAIAHEVSEAGILTARYHDLEQTQRRSTAPLKIGEGSRPDRPGTPYLGTLQVAEEPPPTPLPA